MTAQPKKPIKYSEEEWYQLQSAFKSLTDSTTETARKVLVEGRSPADVAKEQGCSRQTVHAAVKRVRARLDKHEAAKLVPILAWVVEEEAESIKSYIRQQGGVIEGEKTKG